MPTYYTSILFETNYKDINATYSYIAGRLGVNKIDEIGQKLSLADINTVASSNLITYSRWINPVNTLALKIIFATVRNTLKHATSYVCNDTLPVADLPPLLHQVRKEKKAGGISTERLDLSLHNATFLRHRAGC